MTTPLTEIRLLTPAQAAVYLGCSESKVYRLVNEGRLRALDGIGKGWRIDRLDCDRFVDETQAVKPIVKAGR